jgi:hypothetical protein
MQATKHTLSCWCKQRFVKFITWWRCLCGQGLFGHSQLNHNHRILNTLANLSRFSTSVPPNLMAELTVDQFTLHLPPLISWSLAQRNFLHILSMSCRKFLGGFTAVRKYVGIKFSTVVTNVFLPICFNNFPFQPASRDWSLSMKGWWWTLLIRHIAKGSPRWGN